MTVHIPNDLLSTTQWNELNLHIVDNEAPTTTDEYAAMVTYRDENDRIIARTAADAVHNHWGVYTRTHPLSESSNARTKRMNVQGGTSDTHIEIYGGGDDGDAFFSARSRSEQNGGIRMIGPNYRGSVYVDDLLGAIRIENLGQHHELLRFRLDENVIDILDNPVKGLREINNPSSKNMHSQEWAWDATDSRWLYKDSNEEVHWFRPCGTLD